MGRGASRKARRTPRLDVEALLEKASRVGYTRELVAIIRKAAENDDCEALNTMGMFHQEAVRDRKGVLLVKQDPRIALPYLLRSASLGDPNGMTSAADALSRIGGARRVAEAERLYRKAFRLGALHAAINLACTYQNLGRFRDAVRWFRRALAAGDVSAAVEVARAELYGLGTPRNVRAAFVRLREVARRRTCYGPPNSDRTEAMLIMAEALVHGWPVRRDYAAGIRWLRRAAELGSPVARAMLDAGW